MKSIRTGKVCSFGIGRDANAHTLRFAERGGEAFPAIHTYGVVKGIFEYVVYVSYA